MANLKDSISIDLSQQSLLTAMNHFVQAVNMMDETIMIPTRLKDIAPLDRNIINYQFLIPADQSHESSKLLGTDLHAFYVMLNAIKNELVRGPTESEDTSRSTSKPPEDGHKVNCKETALHSKNEIFDECNSRCVNRSDHIAGMFRHHIRGLLEVLRQLTDTANFVRAKYQEEVGDKL